MNAPPPATNPQPDRFPLPPFSVDNHQRDAIARRTILSEPPLRTRMSLGDFVGTVAAFVIIGVVVFVIMAWPA